MPVKVLLADGTALYREGLRELMGHWEEFEVMGGVRNGKEAIALCQKDAPELIVMDSHLPEPDGIETAYTLRSIYPVLKIVILSTHDDEETLFAALSSGVDGYLLKDIPSRKLRKRLGDVCAGKAVLSDVLMSKVFSGFRRGGGFGARAQHDKERQKAARQVSEREIQILRLLALGRQNEEIAESLYLSQATVKKVLGSLMQRFYLENRVQLAVYAVTSGIVELQGSSG